MLRWVTIFMELKREHINKDVGLIPITMQKYFNYKSAILTVKNIDFISNDMGCNIIETPKWLGKEKLGIARYILRNAKNIDVLNMYHFSLIESVIWILPFKILNPKGRIYLKMDLSTKYMADYTKNKIMLFLRRCFLKFYDLISAESSIVCSYINRYYKNRVELIPNGFYWEKEGKDSNVRNKEILCVARLGAECKCTEILIEAFEMSMDEHDWKLRLVGPMESEFEHWFHDKMNADKKLEKRIIYQGEIINRIELAEVYSKASIFALSSEYESFGIVMVEALSRGCFLLGTDGINSISDIISDIRIGKISRTNDLFDFKKNILESIKIVENETNEDFKYREQYAEKYYSWKNICQNINQLILGSRI